MREAGEGDRPAIEAFLLARAAVAMFPLSNLLAHGLAGDDPAGHPRAMRFWVAGEPWEGVLGLTREGMALPVLPPRLAGEAARALAGRRLVGIIGEAEAARALRDALGLGGAPCEKAEEEGLWTLDLARLRMPPTEGLALVSLEAVPQALLLDWSADYGREALGWPAGEAARRAEAEVAASLAGGRHRVLLREGEPVARTGFNARVPGVVQVGGVWVPPPLRGQGLARAAVALHLTQARGQGAARAVLFTANPFAERAYRALGFEAAGRYALHLFAGPEVARRG